MDKKMTYLEEKNTSKEALTKSRKIQDHKANHLEFVIAAENRWHKETKALEIALEVLEFYANPIVWGDGSFQGIKEATRALSQIEEILDD